MWFVILGRDEPDALPRRLAARGAHLERLASLRDAGRLLLAGPLPAIEAEDPGPAGFAGSLIVAEFFLIFCIKNDESHHFRIV